MDREPREGPGREFRDPGLREDPGLRDPELREDPELGDPELRTPEAAEEKRKEQARQEYVHAGFSPASFEADWPMIRSRLAAEEVAHRLAMADPESGDLATNRRRGWRGQVEGFWGGWIGLVIVAIIILWLWWIAIWGWGAWGNGGARGGVGAGQNQPVQQAPQKSRKTRTRKQCRTCGSPGCCGYYGRERRD